MSLPPAGLDALDAQRFHLIANALPALLAYVDAERRYLWVNAAYRSWFGHAPESFRGRHLREVLGEAAWPTIEPHVGRALAGEAVSFEAPISFGPGHERVVKVAYFPDREASGRVRGFVSFVNDVSDVRRAEKALRESERLLADSQAAAHVGSWEIALGADGSGDVLHLSDEAYRVFGLGRSVVFDRALFYASVHPDDRQQVQGAARAATERAGRCEAEFRIVRPDGTVRDIQSWFMLERDAAGAAIRWQGTCQDITARKRAESDGRGTREQLQVVVDATPAMISRYDAGLRLVWANRHYAALFARRPEDLVGRALREIVGEQAFATLAPEMARVLAGEELDLEIDIPYPNLGRRAMHLVVSPTYDSQGTIDGGVSVMTDNTHHRQIERDRERALAELKEVDRRKDEFLAMLSHELRNPMAPILSAVELLRLAPFDAESSRAARGVIERQVLHMKRLLDDLLDVSRVSWGKISLHREMVDLGWVLSQALEVSRPLMTERGQQFSLNHRDGTILVHADSARLVQVFGNLLNNAAKYSEPAGAIEADLFVEEDEAVVKVRDRGVGMTPELLERAFDLFEQDARSLDRAQGGIGIGLTLVRSLVTLHGGSVQAFSGGPGQGCEIVVRLPRASAGVPRYHRVDCDGAHRHPKLPSD